MCACMCVPATHTAHRVVWSAPLRPEGGGQRGGGLEHPRATGGHLGCSVKKGNARGWCRGEGVDVEVGVCGGVGGGGCRVVTGCGA